MRRRRVFSVWVPRQYLWVALGLLGLLSFVWYVSAPPPFPVLAPLTEAVSGKKIVIDAGHGGIDAGAKSDDGLTEKEITLDLARRLKSLFSRVGVYVIMTREDDRDLAPEGYGGKAFQRKRADLLERVRLANESKADLYLSIHANSFPEPQWSGAQTFFKSSCPDGRELARFIQNELVARLGPNHRKAKSASYRVLNDTRMPAALVEVGFLSNPREARLLAEPDYRAKLAESIYQGTIRYLARAYQSRRAAPPETVDETGASGRPAVPGQGRDVRPAPNEAILYFAAAGNGDGLVSEVRAVPGLAEASSIAARAKILVLELIKGPGAESVLAPILPPQTRLLGVAYSKGRLYVNFGEELCLAFEGGGRAEELAICSLVDTLTLLEGVNSVQFTIAGRSDVTIAGHIALDAPFTRCQETSGVWKE